MSSDGAEASISSDDAKNLASELLAFEREMWELHHPGLLPEVVRLMQEYGVPKRQRSAVLLALGLPDVFAGPRWPAKEPPS